MKRYLISCLEASANLHFQEVLNALGECEICGIFDKKFEKFGSAIYDSKEFSAMGFVEVLPLIFKAKKAMKKMVELAGTCDGVLLIDSPAFNLPLAQKLKEQGIKTPITYYILPQVWAWKKGRVAKVEKYCDNLASILPFDSKFYTRSKYVRHPLLDEIKTQKQSYEKNGKIVFMPGSRRSEITRLMPIYRELASKFANSEKILVVPKFLMSNLDEIYGETSKFKISNNTIETLKDAEFAFICSGTATLEAALIGTPFVLCYKAKAIDIFLARCFVKLKHVGLANIIFDFMGKEALHTELLQDEVSAENLYKAYQNCDYEKFRFACANLREYLKFGSAKNVANLLEQS